MHNYSISEETLSKELHQKIYSGFQEHSKASTGIGGNIQEVTLVARDGDTLLGVFSGRTFWGGLHIKYLFIFPEARGKGLGRALMLQGLAKGKDLNCRFAFVETMSFQALEFYKRLGFEEEFSRSGHDKETSFHYLKKEFSS